MRFSRIYAALLAGSLLLPGLALANDADSAPVSFDFEAVFATRTASSGSWLGDINGVSIASGSDLPFGWAPGIEAALTARHGDKDIVVRFLGGLSFSAADRRTTPALASLPSNPPLYLIGAADVVTRYTSGFNSIEANIAQPMDSARLFAGLRGVLVNETLGHDMVFASNAVSVIYGAATAGIGPQVGADARFGDDVFVEVDARLAGLVTKSQLSMVVNQMIGPDYDAAGDPWGWAALFEAGIAVGAKVGPSTSVALGYKAIYLHNVPTALSTIRAADVMGGTVGRTGDGLLIHGVTAGIAGEF